MSFYDCNIFRHFQHLLFLEHDKITPKKKREDISQLGISKCRCQTCVIQSKKHNPILRSIPGPSKFSLKKVNTGFYGPFPNPPSSLPLLVLFPFYPVLFLQKALGTISEGTRSQKRRQRPDTD